MSAEGVNVTTDQVSASAVFPGAAGTHIDMSLVVAPTVTGVTASVSNAADVGITVTGNNLTGATEVWIVAGGRKILLPSLAVVNATTITSTVPAGTPAGTYNIRVLTPGGFSAPSVSTLTVGQVVTRPVVQILSQSVVTQGSSPDRDKPGSDLRHLSPAPRSGLGHFCTESGRHPNSYQRERGRAQHAGAGRVPIHVDDFF